MKILMFVCILAAMSCRTDVSGRDAGEFATPDEGTSTNTDGGVASAVCAPTIGLTTPARPCTPSDPCTNIAALDDSTLAQRPADVPSCVTTSGLGQGRGAFDDGPPMSWQSTSGLTRHWCEYVPPQASAANPVPVVVFLHGTGGGAANVYDTTSLRQKAVDRPFILISAQARNLHVPTEGRTDSAKWDEFHRDLRSPSQNLDVTFLDHILDSLGPEADLSQIYLSGWSNGGFMAQLYAIARHETATPGGQRVAAAAVYSAADPFHDIIAGEPCRLDPYPTSKVPLMVVSRACDLIACDEDQAVALRGDGIGVPAGRVVETWIADAAERVGTEIVWRRLSGLLEVAGREVDQCSNSCGSLRATTNHIRWPDGVADDSGTDHEPAMLEFLYANPLPMQ